MKKALKPDLKSASVGGVEGLTIEKCSARQIKLPNLVSELQAELHYDRDRIIQRLMELKESRKITIFEAKPYKSLLSYIFSPMSLWFWGTAFSTMISLVLIFVTSGLLLYLRYVFGGLLVLFLPGYSLIELLYSKKQELDDLTRVALSIGLSLALAPLAGLALNYTPFGIRLIPVAVSLALLTLVFLFLGVRRKHEYYKIAKEVS